MMSQVVFLPSIMLSGIMFPAALLPAFLEKPGRIFPATWGYILLSAETAVLSDFLPLFLILACAALISVLLLKRMRAE